MAKKNAKKMVTNSKPAKADTSKKLSQVDAAIRILADAKKPMSCKAMVAKKLWSSPNGKTPEATLYSAILRDLKRGKESRFVKAAPGQFTLTK